MKISNLSWIHRGGVVENFFLPQSIIELQNVITKLNCDSAPYIVVGHTSNLYFKNSYNIENLVCTRKLTNFYITEDTVVCECGVPVKKLAEDMVNKGYSGFEGLVDLPGTIGAALVNNSGCYSCSISNLLKDAQVLLPEGVIRTYTYDDFAFSFRSSKIKRKEMLGVILSVTLALNKGNAEEIKRIAERCHQNRRQTQPGPLNNLGTTYNKLGERTLFGKIISIVSGIYSKLLAIYGLDIQSRGKKKSEFEIILAGGKKVLPYLWSINYFIWKDQGADEIFLLYQKILKRLYIHPELEIEIFE